MAKIVLCSISSCRRRVEFTDALIADGVLSCPGCGQRFRLRSTSAATLSLPKNGGAAGGDSAVELPAPSEQATLSLTGKDTTPPVKPNSKAATLSRAAASGTSTGVEPVNHGLPAHAPRQVGRFTVVSKLGEGAFGEVDLARDLHLERDVALKLAKPEMLSSPERVERFLRWI